MQISVIGPLEGADASGSVGAAVEGPAADDMADAITGTRARQSDKSGEIRREISQQTGCGLRGWRRTPAVIVIVLTCGCL